MTTAARPSSDLGIHELRRAFRGGVIASDVAAWLLRTQDNVRRTAYASGVVLAPDAADARKGRQ
jgi:hypothetical protein